MSDQKDDSKWAGQFSVVITVLAIIAAILILGYQFTPSLRMSGPARAKANKIATITQIRALCTALDSIKVDMGHYPEGANGLQDLVIQPAGATNWHQYLEKVPLDPWGNPYRYDYPGKHLTNSYDLSSAGPDGKFGTDDDISNWKYPQK